VGVWPIIAAIRPEQTWWILVSCAVIALLVIVGGLGVWYYRKQFLFPDRTEGGGLWTFEDLRQMRDRGDLTEEEYQSLRAAMIGSFDAKPKQTGGLPRPNSPEDLIDPER